ncbi:23S rRNA (uracil(1939)-C(5))-methyltransferase RlmD [Caloranaerobacter azorensis]|uniref:23S rRNA (Uracil(1939)-C(5))-methyltransferase RlmD n=1 Tax=Caloranaerobacter azorensis TaxID=116090 RepID=A0A6P1YC27_9FIRM|nr:23S rRNA (uracil(1939)-C(5))-methyltransferase RlmD [Caloranaerobacter azorensis]QIB26859.1 23S rRNA (uracil(1939)-C(5))-methyltransferase RlmD [Caloranaerobacter azorensis]
MSVIKLNEIYEVKIEDINHKGQGVAKIEGFTVFIDGGLPGDKCKVKLINIKKNYGVGEIVSIIEPSTKRVIPKCKISYACGGCQIQGLDYQEQLKIKTNKVKNDIKKIGHLEDVVIHDTLGMDNPYRYRNKAQFPVGRKNKKTAIGFYKRGSHEIVDTNSCIIQHEVNDKIIKLIKAYMKTYNIKPYDEKTGTGLIRHILTKTAFKTGDVMVVIITNGEKLPYKDKLIEILKNNITNLKSVIQNINTKKTNVILGDKTNVLFGTKKIIDYIGDLKFNISAKSFFQVNPVQTEVLYNKALEYAKLEGNEIVFDLYCGIGTISLFLAKKAKKVYGIEVVKEAIVDAMENARINSIENVEFYEGTAEEIFPKLYNHGIKADVVVVDPPRKGCDKKVLDTIVKMSPKRVVYVSCNPSTLARDLKYLYEKGYKTIEIQPVDMFPHTMHVECVVKIEKK